MISTARSRAAVGAAIAAVIALGAASCASTPTVLVAIHDDGTIGAQFNPAVLVIDPGTEVRWRNAGARAHGVAVAENVDGEPAMPTGATTWDSGPLLPGEVFAIRLDVPGVYVYRSGDQPNAVATIQVGEP